MGYSTPQQAHLAVRPHQCSWCAETIAPGDTYYRWRWYDGAYTTTCKLHDECRRALNQESGLNGGGPIEFSPGDNPRGAIAGTRRIVTNAS